jgi:hypothetical protein
MEDLMRKKKHGERVRRGVRHGGYRVIRSYCVYRSSSILVEEGAIVRDYRGLERIKVMIKCGKINYSLSDL